MGKKKSKKKDHKKKKSSKDKRRSRSSSSSSSTSSSSSDTPKKATAMAAPTKTAKEALDEFFHRGASEKNWHLAQKSEQLLFDQVAEPEEKMNETFVWRKKNQKIGLDKLDPQQMLMVNKLKQEETARELEKVKRRKIEREREREERDREHEFLQRQKETEYHKEWESQEDSFHLKQVKLRSTIRIREGRAKPIDLLAKYISAEDDDLDVEMHEPYTYLNGLTIRDLEDLLVDIRVYSDLEAGVNADYWRDIAIVTEDELKKLQLMDKNSREHVGDRREGINQSVLRDVSSMFKGKTYEQLVELEQSIRHKIQHETGIDFGYWDSLAVQLKAHMARARLRERHYKVLHTKLASLKRKQGIATDERSTTAGDSKQETETIDDDDGDDGEDFEKRIQERILKEQAVYRQKQEEAAETSSKPRRKSTEDDDEDDDEDGLGAGDDDDEFDKLEAMDEQDEASMTEEMARSLNAYEAGKYSPRLLEPSELAFDTFVITADEDEKRLATRRAQVLGTGALKPSVEDAFEAKARETMGGILANDDDQEDHIGGDASQATTAPAAAGKAAPSAGATAGAKTPEKALVAASGKGKSNTMEVNLDHHYLWSDKYRPRKPRYYNRVHTGYDWNQYNKKHYDIDNPPPKTVQGYKFNIFYPDMIDKTKTPRYSISVCQDNKDFAILRFHAGAPYEDVAFKIVNREWDISHRHGFRNQFQNGIYQIWFHFRKWKYRR